MSNFPDDIFTEPQGCSVNTLKQLSPLTGMAGIWEGIRGLDIKQKAHKNSKTYGPELFYGLGYYAHSIKLNSAARWFD